VDAGGDGRGPADGRRVAAEVCFENGPEARLRAVIGKDDEGRAGGLDLSVGGVLDVVTDGALGRSSAADRKENDGKLCQES
jgi:hypothetical protein